MTIYGVLNLLKLSVTLLVIAQKPLPSHHGMYADLAEGVSESTAPRTCSSSSRRLVCFVIVVPFIEGYPVHKYDAGRRDVGGQVVECEVDVETA